METSDLPNVVNNLIDKISHVAGILWEPKQIVRIAEAEAKADMIRAIGELKVEAIKELAERTGKRFVYEELRKQYNMESIIGKAIPAIEEKCETARRSGRLDCQLLRQVPFDIR